jgi:hypothetical protein
MKFASSKAASKAALAFAALFALPLVSLSGQASAHTARESLYRTMQSRAEWRAETRALHEHHAEMTFARPAPQAAPEDELNYTRSGVTQF